VAIGIEARELKAIAATDEALTSLLPKTKTIVNAALDFERLLEGLRRLVELGTFEPTYEPVSVNSLLASTKDAYAERASKKGLRFIVTERDIDAFVWTDAIAAQRMLNNLVSNAIKYTCKGMVFVRSVKYRGELRIDVLDSGVGIPEEKSHDIYKEFVRLSHPEVKDAGGLGLGLAIVVHFRDKLVGHHVQHKSAPGRGSRFSVTLPLAPQVPVVPQHISSMMPALPLEKLYVVIVEDHESVRNQLVTVLHSAGYNVHDNVKCFATASDLRVYFSGANHRAPNVVISDYRLLDGETADDVIQAVDEFFSWEEVPVIIYSAEIVGATTFEREHAYFLTKSSDPLPLLELVQRAVWTCRQDDTDSFIAFQPESASLLGRRLENTQR
jgi:FixJ family two-component response regulator